MEKNRLVLEKSTHTHEIESNGIISSTELAPSTIKLKMETGVGIVRHGEHGTIRTESENVIKYVQQEFNPVTQAMQNAYD